MRENSKHVIGETMCVDQIKQIECNPNGIPKDAQRTCIECIHLDESQLEKQKIRCSKIDREAKRAMWLYVMRDKGQSNLETFI